MGSLLASALLYVVPHDLSRTYAMSVAVPFGETPLPRRQEHGRGGRFCAAPGTSSSDCTVPTIPDGWRHLPWRAPRCRTWDGRGQNRISTRYDSLRLGYDSPS